MLTWLTLAAAAVGVATVTASAMSTALDASTSWRLPSTTALSTCPEASVKSPKSSVLTCLTPEAAAVVTSVPSRVTRLAGPEPTACTMKGAFSAFAVSFSVKAGSVTGATAATASTATASPASMRVSSSARTLAQVCATVTTRATGALAIGSAALRPSAISCRVAEASAV